MTAVLHGNTSTRSPESNPSTWSLPTRDSHHNQKCAYLSNAKFATETTENPERSSAQDSRPPDYGEGTPSGGAEAHSRPLPSTNYNAERIAIRRMQSAGDAVERVDSKESTKLLQASRPYSAKADSQRSRRAYAKTIFGRSTASQKTGDRRQPTPAAVSDGFLFSCLLRAQGSLVPLTAS